jgi:FkbM family methyltransferase
MRPFRLTLAQLLARPLPPIVAAHASMLICPFEAGRQDAYTFRRRACTGSWYQYTTRDPQAHVFAIHGYFDWRILAVARYFCRPGDTVVEVGANVGTETIGLADLVGPQGKVYAFEPVPENADQLERTFASAGLTQVEVIRAAVSDSNGTACFSLARNEFESGTGHLSLGSGSGEASVREIQVSCVTLDSILTDKRPIRLLASDTEGAELMVLRGGSQILQRDHPVVIVEASEPFLRRFGGSLKDLHAELARHGYSVFELARLGLTPARGEPPTRSPNWLALPPALAGEAGRLRRHLVRSALMPCVGFLNPLRRPVAAR